MVKTPRILYGLHEIFVLFPYDRGSKRAGLVLRAPALRTFCRTHQQKVTVQIGAPLVLGELLDGVTKSMLVPVVYTGTELNAMKRLGAHWGIRHHRAVPFGDTGLRFETGSQTVFATHTSYYSIEFLLQLTKEAKRAEDKADTRQGFF